jgi:hypothetical protein
VRGLLVRGLGARRHEAVLLRPRAGGAVAHREDVVVGRGLQRLPHHELVDAVGLQAVEAGEEFRPLTPCRPHHQLRRQDAAVGQAHAVGEHLGHLGAGMHLDAELAQQALGGRDRRSGSAGSTRGAASIRASRMSLSASTRSRP